jgi:hypothetical protein
MMRPLLLAATVIAASWLPGCADQRAYGRTENVQNAWPAVSGYTKSNIEVMVLDQRPYVLSHDKSATFVGLQRGGYGNPFDVATSSGQPLAADLETAIRQGFENAGISTSAHASVGQTKASAPGHLLLMIAVAEWKSDTFTTTSFAYDLSATVFDTQGKLLGTQRISATRNISSGVDGGRQALSELLGSKTIASALFGQAP